MKRENAGHCWPLLLEKYKLKLKLKLRTSPIPPEATEAKKPWNFLFSSRELDGARAVVTGQTGGGGGGGGSSCRCFLVCIGRSSPPPGGPVESLDLLVTS
jgi:hypothetical protein